MSRLTRKRARQWARYVNRYESISHPAIGGSSFLRVIWRGMYRQDPATYKYIRRQVRRVTGSNAGSTS
jgi:hypothetical protein